MKTFIKRSFYLLSLTFISLSSHAQTLSENWLLSSSTPDIMSITNSDQPIPQKASAALEGIIDSTYTWTWNTTTESWNTEPTYKRVDYSYTNNYDLIGSTTLNFDGVSWENQIRFTNTYDASHNLIGSNYQSWEIGNWEDTYQWINHFDGQGNMDTSLTQSWNGTAWETLAKITTAYNANNQPINEIHQNWNLSDWEYNSLTTYSYDGNDLLAERLIERWINGSWQESMRINYTYDLDGNITNELVESFESSVWENHVQRNNFYNGTNNLIRTVFETWAGTGWESASEFLIGYDTDDLINHRVAFQTNNNGSNILGGDSTQYYYHTVNTGIETAPNEQSIMVYPNPSTGVFQAALSNGLEKAIYTVYNNLGKAILTGKASGSNFGIDLSDQPTGLYSLQIQRADRVRTERLIKY